MPPPACRDPQTCSSEQTAQAAILKSQGCKSLDRWRTVWSRRGGTLSGLWGLKGLLGDFIEYGLPRALKISSLMSGRPLVNPLRQGQWPQVHLNTQAPGITSPVGPLSLLVPLGKCRWCTLGGSPSCPHTGHAQKLLQDTDAWTPSRARNI